MDHGSPMDHRSRQYSISKIAENQEAQNTLKSFS